MWRFLFILFIAFPMLSLAQSNSENYSLNVHSIGETEINANSANYSVTSSNDLRAVLTSVLSPFVQRFGGGNRGNSINATTTPAKNEIVENQNFEQEAPTLYVPQSFDIQPTGIGTAPNITLTEDIPTTTLSAELPILSNTQSGIENEARVISTPSDPVVDTTQSIKRSPLMLFVWFGLIFILLGYFGYRMSKKR